MLNRMRRMFSSLYPFHPIAKSEAQKLIDFPLQFYSSEIPSTGYKNSLFDERSFSAKYPEVLEGATHSCGAFLSLLAEQNLETLQDLVEWNMFKALENTFKSYQDLGYTISSIGSTENAEAEILDYNVYSSILLPYRNLNPKIDELDSYTTNKKVPFPTIYEFFPKNMEIAGLIQGYFNYFLKNPYDSLRLKEMNKNHNAEPYRKELLNFGWILYANSVEIHSFDIGFKSSFKLIVRDKEGNIIEGTDDENKVEFHSFRIEKLAYEKGIFTKLLSPHLDFVQFLDEKFPGLLNQFIISDVDGFMNGNPLAS